MSKKSEEIKGSLVESETAGTGTAINAETGEETRGGESLPAAEPSPNVAYVGRHEPPRRLNNGMDFINLPDAETQKKPFYHKQASVICRLMPMLYKPVKEIK